MAVQISTLFVSLRANYRQFSAGMSQASKAMRGLRRATERLATSFRATVLSARTLLAAIAGLGTAVGMAVKAMKVSAEFERQEIALAAMTKNAEKASKFFKDLQKFALKTPFRFKELLVGAKTLIAYGEAIDNVIPTLAVLGNVAAGTGANLEHLAFIFGQSRAEMVAQWRDLRQFATQGIPVISELARMHRITENEVRKLTMAGKVHFAVLAQALKNLATGSGHFAGVMGELANTLSGIWARVQDQIELFARDVGDMIVNVFNVKSILLRFFNWLQHMRTEEGRIKIGEWLVKMREGMIAVVKYAGIFLKTILQIRDVALTILAYLAALVESMRSLTFRTVGKGLTGLAATLRDFVAEIWEKFVAHVDEAAHKAGGLAAAILKLRDSGHAFIESLPDFGEVLRGWFSTDLTGTAQALVEWLQRMADRMTTGYDNTAEAYEKIDNLFKQMKEDLIAVYAVEETYAQKMIDLYRDIQEEGTWPAGRELWEFTSRARTYDQLIEKRKEENELIKQAAKWQEALLDPVKKYRQEEEQINKMLDRGLLTANEHAKALQMTFEQIFGKQPKWEIAWRPATEFEHALRADVTLGGASVPQLLEGQGRTLNRMSTQINDIREEVRRFVIMAETGGVPINSERSSY